MTNRQINAWTWAARLLTLLSLLAGVLAAADYLPQWVQRYAALAVALSGAAVGWIRGFLPAVKSRVLPVAVLLAVSAALMLSACPKPYDAAWRTLDSIQKARDLTAQQLAAAGGAKHKDCLKDHGPKTQAFAECIQAHRKALEQWQKNARPAINSSIQVTVTALQIAERTKAEKMDWISLLRPAACALFRVAKAWGHYWPDKGKAVLNVMSLLEGVTCE